MNNPFYNDPKKRKPSKHIISRALSYFFRIVGTHLLAFVIGIMLLPFLMKLCGAEPYPCDAASVVAYAILMPVGIFLFTTRYAYNADNKDRTPWGPIAVSAAISLLLYLFCFLVEQFFSGQNFFLGGGAYVFAKLLTFGAVIPEEGFLVDCSLVFRLLLPHFVLYLAAIAAGEIAGIRRRRREREKISANAGGTPR